MIFLMNLQGPRPSRYNGAIVVKCSVEWKATEADGSKGGRLDLVLPQAVSYAGIRGAFKATALAALSAELGRVVDENELIPFTLESLVLPGVEQDPIARCLVGSGDTSIPIADYIGQARLALSESVTRYLEESFSGRRTRSMQLLYQTAEVKGLNQRISHIKIASDWVETVIAEYAVRDDALEAAKTHAEVDAVEISFASFDATKPNPLPTVKSTVKIPN